jgi:hypothetical protein
MIPVKIKAEKYGAAIGLLMRMGAGFQTRFRDMLIVNSEQLHALEEAGFVEANGNETKTRKRRGEKSK